ncbi:MAG: TolC family protein [Planctomycetes bacterium]|nr:TolC family protein [Planctomycetota bacterium]MBL7008866.1 TolC family protein [Planctomycetota bacterium]
MLTLLLLSLLPSSFQEAVAEAVQDPAAQAADDTFPLRVEDVVRLVGQNAPAFHQARLRALASVAGIEEAEGIFDPVLFGDLTYSYGENPTSGGLFAGGLPAQHVRSWQAQQGLRSVLVTGATVQVAISENYTEDNLPQSFFGFNPQSDVGLNFNVTQPLLRGGWLVNGTYGVRSAELAAGQAGAGVRQSETAAVQGAVDAYWDLAFAIEDVKVKQLSLKLAEELREVTLAKFRVGSAAEVEVVQTDADIAVRTEALLTARNLVAQVQDRLRLLLFPLEDPGDWNLVFLPVSQPPAPEGTGLAWESAFQVAMEHRADLRQLGIDLEQKRLDWDVARRNQLPKLDLIASGNSSGTARQIADAFETTRGFYFVGYSLGLAFELPLGNRQFDGASRRNRYAFELAQRTLRDKQNEVATEVREAVRNLNYQAERVKATELASRVAQRQLQAEQRRLQEGASTNFQVLQFQRDLETALSGEKNARMEYAKAAIRLQTVQGLNWDGSLPASARPGPEPAQE